MRITYIKTKNTENLNIPELSEKIGNILSKYLNENNELDSDCYVCIDETNGITEENFMFMDAETTNNIINFYREYNFLIEYKDITDEVKNGVCEIGDFKKHFNYLDECKLNTQLLDRFLQENMTTDDVLDKIYTHGINHLTELDKKLL